MTLKEPAFQPKAGQVDFTHARYCPTVNCLVRCQGKILIARRPAHMNFYPGLWSGITGFLDNGNTLEEQAAKELQEELGCDEEAIIDMRRGRIYELEAPEYRKIWIIHPVLVEINTLKTILNWENEEVRWIDSQELDAFECTPGFIESARELLVQ